ncbi:selenocysteinyl-tRNA-specific translation factor, partial [Klebsiella aerogenes]
MIIATAGHVDHGKTTLLQAITGVNADRLPEEKSRGMTIDLATPIGRSLMAGCGFIDVPGHEKFLSNMLAGVGGIDHALLVVACDDGVMAQTREHLAILQLTGKPTLTRCVDQNGPRGRGAGCRSPGTGGIHAERAGVRRRGFFATAATKPRHTELRSH